jgi:hypothetical protein
VHLDLEVEEREELVQVELTPRREVLPTVSKFRPQLSLMLGGIALEPAFKLCPGNHGTITGSCSSALASCRKAGSGI